MHRGHCCSQKVTHEYIGLIFCPSSLCLAGWNEYLNQKKMRKIMQSVHDTGHINEGLAALRHHNAKGSTQK